MIFNTSIFSLSVGEVQYTGHLGVVLYLENHLTPASFIDDIPSSSEQIYIYPVPSMNSSTIVSFLRVDGFEGPAFPFLPLFMMCI